MKSSISIAATASVALASRKSLKSLGMTSSQDFINYGVTYSKNYKTTRDLLERAEIFGKACDEINRLNYQSQQSGRKDAAVYGHNFTSDMTAEEY